MVSGIKDLKAQGKIQSGLARGSGRSDIISLCIGGRMFLTRIGTLCRFPGSRLYMIANHSAETSLEHDESGTVPDVKTNTVAGASLLEPQQVDVCLGNMNNLVSGATVCSNSQFRPNTNKHSSNMPSSVMPYYNSTAPVYYFDRDPEIFRFVLDYYRTGELHLPSNICGPFARKELIFWGIEERYIEGCCMPAYTRYYEEKRTKLILFRDCFEDIDSMQYLVSCSQGMKKWRYKMWLFLDHPSSSLPAKVWASILLVLMIASVMCYCLSTHKNFRQPVKFYIDDSHLIGKSFCRNNTEDEPKKTKYCFTEPSQELIITDISLNVLFSLEFILKLVLCPDKKKFLSSIISFFDITLLGTYWIFVVTFFFAYYNIDFDSILGMKQETILIAERLYYLNVCISATQTLRIFRIFKISKISRGLRVLMLTVKKSIPELVLLCFLLMNGMFLFSSMIYLAQLKEKEFTDIPEAFWWTIVTLTTVGYGDLVPKGMPGYFVGSLTAVSGCILTGLAIPIIGNNFNTYYKYMKNQLKNDKYIKELERDLKFSGDNLKHTLAKNSALPGMKMRNQIMRNRVERHKANGERQHREKLSKISLLEADHLRNKSNDKSKSDLDKMKPPEVKKADPTMKNNSSSNNIMKENLI